MRLLNTERVELEFFIDEIPPYAILSHTWEQEEVIFQDMEQGQAKDKKGYAKIKNCCSIAHDNGYNYVWIDTCCIDKTSSAELTEAINSMYRYYREAEVCYSFLSDISSPSDFSQSRWFTRGWTLQELIAPARMIFFNKEWKQLGTRESLGVKISERTGIPQAILSGTKNLESASISQRMSWAAGRKTTRLEDRAYCLMGIFDINMPLLYGEGHKAFIRLQEEILKVSDDHSIFAWRHTNTRSDGGLLAETPDAFEGSKNIISWNPFAPYNSPFTVTNKGVHLDAPFIAQAQGGLGLMILHCTETGSKDKLVGIYLRDPFLTMEHFERCQPEEFTLINLGRFSPSQYPTRNLCIRLRGKILLTTAGSLSKDQALQPRHFTEGDQISKTDGAGDVKDDEQKHDLQQRLFLAASEGNEARVKRLLALSDINADSKNWDKRTPLSLAAQAGNERIVDLLLNRREVDINSRDKYGLSPLSYAAALGHEKVVWILLARSDIVVSSKDRKERTIVCLAARRGHKNLVEQLLTRKDTRGLLVDGRGRSVLSYAAETGQEDIVRLILGTGKVHPDARDQGGKSALWYASKNGHTGPVKLLLETGWVNPNIRGDDGQTALWHACKKGYDAIARGLLEKGADPDAVMTRGILQYASPFDSDTESLKSDKESLQSDTESLPSPSSMACSKEATDEERPSSAASRHSSFGTLSVTEARSQKRPSNWESLPALWQAASRGYHAIVQSLLENHATPHDRDGGLPALYEAVRRGHNMVIKVFLEKCPRSQDWDHQISMAIACAIQSKQASSVEILMNSFENVGAVARTHWSPRTILSFDETVVELLLDNGADVNESFGGRETLAEATPHDWNKFADAIVSTYRSYRLSLGRDSLVPLRDRRPVSSMAAILIADGYNSNALWCAVVAGQETMLEVLLRHGADTEAKIKDGRTVLFFAISQEHHSIVRLLLKHGANIEARDKNGWSLLISTISIFAHKTDSDMLQLLLDGGADVEAKDWDGNTPLMHGAWCLTTAELLLARGADVNARNKHGVTPLMKAVLYKENTDVVRLFLEHGADPRAKDETDRTAASQAKDEAVLSLLREYSEIS